MRVVISLVCLLASATGLSAQTPTTMTSSGGADSSARQLPSVPLYPEASRPLDEQLQAFTPKASGPLQTYFVYDVRNNMYLLGTYYQGRPLATPIAYTPQEFFAYIARLQNQSTYTQLNNGLTPQRESAYAHLFDFPSRGKKLGLLEQLFGPGGLRLNYNGYIDLSAGAQYNSIDNPSLSERARRNTSFDFRQQFQVNATARLGTKLRLDLSYSTQPSIRQEGTNIKLTYDGGEDDILRQVEVGKVRMQTRNSLVGGGESLFGISSKLQLGRLSMDLLVSQQRSQRRRLQTQGNNEIQNFELSAADYDENRHFFLSGFFRARYEEALRDLPLVNTAVRITRIELWVSNKRGQYEDARHVAAFADLGEHNHIHNSYIQRRGSDIAPNNQANSLYALLTEGNAPRALQRLGERLPSQIRIGLDYERQEQARRLSPSEYTLNEHLGYVSLHTRLQPDEVLAVAYEYTYEGKTYRVGELSRDFSSEGATDAPLFVKLLKGTHSSPDSPYASYMMRNVYHLGNAISGTDGSSFNLEVLYRSDKRGLSLPYLPESQHEDKRLLHLLGLDRINQQNEPLADNRFDYLPGITILPERGWIYLPSVEPFGSTLASRGIEDSFLYHELYRQSATVAKQNAERNKYILRGRYMASAQGEIQLGATQISPGSVRITAGGQELREGEDYIVDYMQGTARITNSQILASNLPLDIHLEENDLQSQVRRSLLGVDLNYQLSKSLNLGASALYLSELPSESKLSLGNNAISNLLWGAQLNWQQSLPSLQRFLTRLRLNNPQVPSQIKLQLEGAQLRPGRYNRRGYDNYSYIDDFDNSSSDIDLRSPQLWHLASTPYERIASGSSNMLEHNYGRGHLSWFMIDPIFTRAYSQYTPAYIRSNPNYTSNHYIREVAQHELYPHREQLNSLVNSLNTLNLRFYPRERGMYNLNTSRLDAEGYFTDPRNSWAGIMRKLDLSDFEAANVEYLDFWLMDPNIDQPQRQSGSLYFDIGDISEDLLADGLKSYENGLPSGNNESATSLNDWGRIATNPSLGYSFDSNPAGRLKQDVGLNGLSSIDEGQHPSYLNYLGALQRKLSSTAWSRQEGDKHAPLNDPAGDDFEHYSSSRYDALQTDILERYKYYNGLEGNSKASEDGRILASQNIPDAEDINQDNTLNELNRYYSYRISLRPEDLRVGTNHIIASRSVEVRLSNGELSPVTWYQFRIPLQDYYQAVGGIHDMRSMRFMRMYLADFAEEVNIRFGSLRLVRGAWRNYSEPLHDASTSPSSRTRTMLSSVNIEEHSERSPVNYVLPPGVERSVEMGSTQNAQRNEQSLSLKVQDLAPQDARAIYRNVQYDLRRYRQLQLFVHAEQLAEDNSHTEDGEMELFLRLGSDYKHNYYEYRIPLKLTLEGLYHPASEAAREQVWPKANFLNLNLDELPRLKSLRNQLAESNPSVLGSDGSYSSPKQDNPEHTLALVGNPSLSHIRTIMLGVRNKSGQSRNIELWLNELRIDEGQEETAWALRTDLGLQLSDWANIKTTGNYSTAGWGGLEQSRSERQQDTRGQLHLSTQVELGKLLPRKAQATIPLFYSYETEQTRPEYSPIDQDIKLEDALTQSVNRETRQLLSAHSLSQRERSSLNLMGAQLAIRSKTPMPYDPANLRLNFSHNRVRHQTPELEYQNEISWDAGLQYDYSPSFTALRPFSALKGTSAFVRQLRDYGLRLWPSHINLSTNLRRHYEEEQMRSDIGESNANRLPLSFAHNFVWYRKMNLSWMPLPSLNLNLQTGTDARIEGAHVQVNRSLNPDDYALWRESVDKSLRQLGTPQRYAQQASASYQLPTSMIPALKWLNISANYNSNYQWELGGQLPSNGEMRPNTIANSLGTELTAQLRLRTLYQMFPSLAKLEQRMAQTTHKGQTARSKTSPLTLGDRLRYALMTLRDISLSIKHNQSTHLPGYLGGIGAALGQSELEGVLRPGLPFSLGFGGLVFIEEMRRLGLLTNQVAQAGSAVITESRIVDLRATLQPLRDLHIQLHSNHTTTRRTDVQYQLEGSPLLYGGDMQMTVIGLRSLWQRATSENNYQSSAYERFLAQRQDVFKHLEQSLGSTKGQVTLGLNSPLVLINAFRNAYVGHSRPETGAIPKLLAMRPNWTITYSGLGRLAPLRKYLSNLTLKHSYRGIYRINSYDSFSSWRSSTTPYIGLVDQGESNSQLWSYAEDIHSVSLNEVFFPLIGADATLNNGLTLTAQWRKSRSLTLSLGASRLIESLNDEWNIGFSYRLAELSRLWRPRSTGGQASSTTKRKQSSYGGLTLRSDYSYQYKHNLIYSLNNDQRQATMAYRKQQLNVSLDYELSRYLTLKGYYELELNTPLVSRGSYSTAVSRYGLALRINLKN
ncbi:MAG: cell surface protein SprA [Porphyromonas sp.]|nr:cell surface protein SprA [Porphyromonas sp.]